MCFARKFARDDFDFSKYPQDEVDVAREQAERHWNNMSILESGSILYKGEKDHMLRRYIPLALRNIKAHMGHSSIFAGHPDVIRSIKNVEALGWWPDTLESDITKFVKTCHPCQVSKRGGTTLDVTYGIGRVVTTPFEELQLDWKPMPKDEFGNTGFYTAFDKATHYSIWKAEKSHTAITAARFLVENIILTFGSPTIIHTGQDSDWVNSLIEQVCCLLGINHYKSFPYSPHGIGGVEHKHLFADNFIRTQGGHQEWAKLIKAGCYVANITFDRSLAMSPFEGMFGRPSLNPYDASLVNLLLQEDPESESLVHTTLAEWVTKLRSNAEQREKSFSLSQLYEAERFSKKRGKLSKKQLENPTNSVRETMTVKIGDLVLVKTSPTKNTIMLGKLQGDPWYGPFIVSDLTPNKLNLTLEYYFDRSIILLRHAMDCKKYFPSDDDSALIDESYGGRVFDVQDILEVSGEIGDRVALVSWTGFPAEFNSRVAVEDLSEELRQRVEKEFPSVEELAIANEAIPIPTNLLNKKDFILPADSIEEVIAVRDTRNGQVIELRLKGEKNARRIQTRQLPYEVLHHPLVSSLLRGV